VADARYIGTLPIAVPELDATRGSVPYHPAWRDRLSAIRRRVTGMFQDTADKALGQQF
jgi:hypothetical protein